MLQQLVRAIFKGVFTQIDSTTAALKTSVTDVNTKVTELKTQLWADVLDKERRIVGNTLSIQSIETRLNQTADELNALTGAIDDKNLDSIREIADRIKLEVQGIQGLREEITKSNLLFSSKLDAFNDAFNKDWDQIVAAIAAEEAAKYN